MLLLCNNLLTKSAAHTLAASVSGFRLKSWYLWKCCRDGALGPASQADLPQVPKRSRSASPGQSDHCHPQNPLLLGSCCCGPIKATKQRPGPDLATRGSRGTPDGPRPPASALRHLANCSAPARVTLCDSLRMRTRTTTSISAAHTQALWSHPTLLKKPKYKYKVIENFKTMRAEPLSNQAWNPIEFRVLCRLLPRSPAMERALPWPFQRKKKGRQGEMEMKTCNKPFQK